MGFAQAPAPPHLYPQSIQIKLYQAFIFSIPILFSIILFLLFYLFYLKRRTTSLSNHHLTLPRSSLPSSDMGLKGNFKEKLPIILFDEELRTRESMCCVCLGEFELKEELHQIPPCRHVFHVDCIRHWLHSNPTCPLCRCLIVLTTTKPPLVLPHFGPNLLAIQENHHNPPPPPLITSIQQQQEDQVHVLGIDRNDQVHVVVTEEDDESSSSSGGCSHPDSVVINIENHHP